MAFVAHSLPVGLPAGDESDHISDLGSLMPLGEVVANAERCAAFFCFQPSTTAFLIPLDYSPGKIPEP